ncbi:MAG: hypothetical protein HRF50_01820 [Phycisphaerae bacterium]|jgi:hypothetical protein
MPLFSLAPGLLLVGLLAHAEAPLKPEALRRAEERRSAAVLRTGRIEYAITWYGLNLPQGQTQQTGYYSWRCAGDRYMVTLQGDQDGVYFRGPDGEPVTPWLNRPERVLAADGEVWQHIEGTTEAHVWGDEQRDGYHLYDLRRLGVSPGYPDDEFNDRDRPPGLPAPVYSSSETDGLHVVTRTVGDWASRWWIDPRRDWSVVRTETLHKGDVLGAWEYELAQSPQDGVWFPRRASMHRFTDGRTEAAVTFELFSVQFNRPDQPLELTQADIGIEPGLNIIYETENAPLPSGRWDGQKVVPEEEFRRRVDAGEIEIGPRVARAYAQVRAMNRTLGSVAVGLPEGALEPAAASRPASRPQSRPAESEWQRYTRSFIARYRLDADQSQKAWAICTQCETRAQAHLARMRSTLDEIEKAIGQLEAHPGDDHVEIEHLRTRRDALLRPVDLIFEKELKPRLDRLPTRAQRAAAHDVAAASQPAPFEHGVSP